MNIGEVVRTIVVEPVVSPVPDGDRPGRSADLPARPTTPTPRAKARQRVRPTGS